MSSGIVQMFCHIVDDVGVLWKSYSSPLCFVFVVPCGTFLNYDEDVDILQISKLL